MSSNGTSQAPGRTSPSPSSSPPIQPPQKKRRIEDKDIIIPHPTSDSGHDSLPSTPSPSRSRALSHSQPQPQSPALQNTSDFEFESTPARSRKRLTQQNESDTSHGQYDVVGVDVEASPWRTLGSDYPKVHQVPLDEMVDAYLPDTPGFDELCKQLVDQEVVDVDEGRDRWTRIIPEAHNSSDTQTTREPQGFAFSFLQDLYSKIMDHYKTISASLPSHSRFVLNPNPKGTTPTRLTCDRYDTAAAMPDGAFLIGTDIREAPEKSLGPEEEYDYLLMVCVMEFKKMDKEEKELDFSKVVWSMHRIMRNDPRRRFVFGLTVEDTKIRFWFHDRATVDWRKLVKIFLAIGTADRVNLGFDDTVSLVEIKNGSGECVLDITVFDEDETQTPVTYRTIERLADHSTDVPTGRGTRVWKVRKIVNGQLVGKDLVLKDSWINEDRTLEHLILQDIRQKLESTGDPRLRHFLTCVQAGRVLSTQVARTKGGGSVYDHTFHVIRRGVCFSQQSALNLLPDILDPYVAKGQRNNKAASIGNISFSPTSGLQTEGHIPLHHTLPDINSNHRVHYRIVFEEVGYPLTKLSKWDEMFFTLQGVLCGLGALHALEYIHRDVSANNILLVKRKCKVCPCKCPTGPTHPSIHVEAEYELVPVIMDLEYALHISSEETQHHVRTGTWQFMAVEVIEGDWYLPEQLTFYTDFNPPPFRQHALHDIESVFWITIWLLFKFILPGTNLEKDNFLSEYQQIFPPHGNTNRGHYFSHPSTFETVLRSVLPQEYTLFLSYIRQWIVGIRMNTIDAYLNCAPANLDSVKIGEGWSASAVKLSIDVLDKMRKVVREEQALQQSLRIVDKNGF